VLSSLLRWGHGVPRRPRSDGGGAGAASAGLARGRAAASPPARAAKPVRPSTEPAPRPTSIRWTSTRCCEAYQPRRGPPGLAYYEALGRHASSKQPGPVGARVRGGGRRRPPPRPPSEGDPVRHPIDRALQRAELEPDDLQRGPLSILPVGAEVSGGHHQAARCSEEGLAVREPAARTPRGVVGGSLELARHRGYAQRDYQTALERASQGGSVLRGRGPARPPRRRRSGTA